MTDGITKSALRKRYLQNRMALSNRQVSYMSTVICDKIIASEEFKKCNKICIYYPIKNEVDVLLLLDECRKNNKAVYLPKTIEDTMSFYQFNESDELNVGNYGIKEPFETIKLKPDSETLVIMPGAVFSKDNNRIGYGGGYYDKFLSQNPSCMTIAAAYSIQIVDSINPDQYDIKPQKIITDTEVYSA